MTDGPPDHRKAAGSRQGTEHRATQTEVTAESTTKPRWSFDCVAFQREQRTRLSRKCEGMTNGEINAWIRDHRAADPILRRCMERTRRRGASDPAIEPKVPAEQSEE